MLPAQSGPSDHGRGALPLLPPVTFVLVTGTVGVHQVSKTGLPAGTGTILAEDLRSALPPTDETAVCVVPVGVSDGEPGEEEDQFAGFRCHALVLVDAGYEGVVAVSSASAALPLSLLYGRRVNVRQVKCCSHGQASWL
jgi:hypothetical protein